MALRIFLSILCISLMALSTWADVAELEGAEFSYSGPNGTEQWGNLSPACSNGKHQSPVDIKKDVVVQNKHLKSMDRNYNPVNATLVNNGFNIGVIFEGHAGDININGKNYSFKQMHWHSPAEHLINGHRFDAELHQVHKRDDGSIAVVAVIFKLGISDPIISKFEDQLAELAKQESARIALGTFHVKQMSRKTRRYYRYVGSLTTPPCKEVITWSVLGKVRSISKKQLELLKAPLNLGCKDNARPVQPLNGRKIEMYYYQANES